MNGMKERKEESKDVEIAFEAIALPGRERRPFFLGDLQDVFKVSIREIHLELGGVEMRRALLKLLETVLAIVLVGNGLEGDKARGISEPEPLDPRRDVECLMRDPRWKVRGEGEGLFVLRDKQEGSMFELLFNRNRGVEEGKSGVGVFKGDLYRPFLFFFACLASAPDKELGWKIVEDKEIGSVEIRLRKVVNEGGGEFTGCKRALKESQGRSIDGMVAIRERKLNTNRIDTRKQIPKMLIFFSLFNQSERRFEIRRRRRRRGR